MAQDYLGLRSSKVKVKGPDIMSGLLLLLRWFGLVHLCDCIDKIL